MFSFSVFGNYKWPNLSCISISMRVNIRALQRFFKSNPSVWYNTYRPHSGSFLLCVFAAIHWARAYAVAAATVVLVVVIVSISELFHSSPERFDTVRRYFFTFDAFNSPKFLYYVLNCVFLVFVGGGAQRLCFVRGPRECFSLSFHALVHVFGINFYLD